MNRYSNSQHITWGAFQRELKNCEGVLAWDGWAKKGANDEEVTLAMRLRLFYRLA